MCPFCVLYFYYITGFVITFVAINNYICLNIKKLNFIAVFVFSFLLFSCGENDMENDYVIHGYRVQNISYAKGSKLKRVYRASKDDKILYAGYEYDESGRISRIDYDVNYEVYLYNVKEQLEKVLTYNKNTSDLISTLVCTYDIEGNKINDQMISENKQMPGHYILYEYSDGKLTK